jgi:ABC-type dipeptide/oligopeptide/nickel transport systems, permease components
MLDVPSVPVKQEGRRLWRFWRRRSAQNQIERLYYASQGQLIWWRFKKHRLALVAMIVLGLMYFVSIFAEFFAPYGVRTRIPGHVDAPPTKIRIYSEDGGFQRPFIYRLEKRLNRATFRQEWVEDTSVKYPIYFFVRGEPYRLFNLISWDVKFIGTGVEDVPLLIFGTDRLGRDVFSRTIHGARVSLFIGFGGVFLSFILGCALGGVSGYFGGIVDEIIQRIIDVLLSMPTIPLWMALAAAIPREWSVTQTYFAITLVLAVVGWAGLARIVRGKLLSLREAEFILAARAGGVKESRIIVKHLLPNFLSFLVVHLTLAVPQTILGETALSFLGLGMQPPAVSWGVLLQEAQNLAVIAQKPWQLIPGAFVVVAVLMFSFMGDGLRDAADPYSR